MKLAVAAFVVTGFIGLLLGASPAQAAAPESHLLEYMMAFVVTFGFGIVLGLLVFWGVIEPRRVATRQAALDADQLKRDEKRFRDLTEASSDWYWELDQHLNYTFVSDRFTDIMGIPARDLIGTAALAYTETDDPASIEGAQSYRQMLTREKSFRDHQVTLTTPDGTRRNLSISGKAIFDDAGTFTGYRGIGADLSEQVMVERELKEASKRLNDSINALGEGFILWDREGRLATWNGTLEHLLPEIAGDLHKGMFRKDLMALLTDRQLVDPTRLTSKLKTPSAAGETLQEWKLADGKYLLVNEHSTQEGGTVGVFTDITEFRTREEDLLASNRFLSAFSRCGEALVHAQDDEFLLNEYCSSLVETLGYGLVSVMQRAPDDEKIEILATAGRSIAFLNELFLSPESPAQKPVLHHILSPKPTSLPDLEHAEAFQCCRDAVLKHGLKSMAAFPLRMEDDDPLFLVVFSDAVSELSSREQGTLEELANDLAFGLSGLKDRQSRMTAEDALRDSEERYRDLVELSPGAILVVQSSQIVFANQSALGMFRAENMFEMLKSQIRDFVDPENEALLLKRIQRSENHGKIDPVGEARMSRLDGTRFAAEITSGPITHHGKPACQIVINDITERKQMSMHLLQASKLATLGEMAAGMAHELSQPLNIIRFAAEGSILKMQRGKLDNDSLKTHLDNISAQCQRMADIIDHMRIFSRKDTSEVEIFDPTVAIRQAIDLVEAQFYAENILLEPRYPRHYAKAKGRPIQLEQVLLNLFTNARDSILDKLEQEKGRIRSGLIDIQIHYDQSENQVMIAVTDNGTGIPDDVLDKLFDPFYTTKEVGRGTGLGLSVSYSIISAMGGEIRVRNVHNGARFEVWLPCAAPEEIDAGIPLAEIGSDLLDEQDDDAVSSGANNGIHVLVVDDEVYAAEALTEHLFELGYRVSMAGDGEEALELFEEDPTDLVVTDIRMPRCDGNTLIRSLMEKAPDVPVIVVTGHLGMGDTESLELTDNVFSVLKKPVSLADLANDVEKAAMNKTAARLSLLN